MTYHSGLGQVKTGTKPAGTTGTAPVAVDNTGRDIGTAFTIGGGLLTSIIGGATGTPATTTETPVEETYTAPPATDWTPLYIGGGILVLGGLGWWALSQRKVAANRRKRRVSANPERFRIYDMGDVPGDRYTIVDSRPIGMKDPNDRRTFYSYFGMNAHPFHPQGIGMHGEFSPSEWRSHVNSRFRGLGKRIQLAALPPEARKAAEQFIRHSVVEAPPKKNGRRGSKRVRRNTKYSYDQSHPYKYDSAGRPVRNRRAA